MSKFETSDDEEEFLLKSEIKKIEKKIVRSGILKLVKELMAENLMM